MCTESWRSGDPVNTVFSTNHRVLPSLTPLLPTFTVRPTPVMVPPTALFTGNNLLTVGALKALHTLGLSIPKDVSLVGHDELPWMSLLAPGITVAAQPIYEMGKQAVEMLLARIQGDKQPIREVRLDPRLIIRQSCAKVVTMDIQIEK